jgi:hypothetical protein
MIKRWRRTGDRSWVRYDSPKRGNGENRDIMTCEYRPNLEPRPYVWCVIRKGIVRNGQDANSARAKWFASVAYREIGVELARCSGRRFE